MGSNIWCSNYYYLLTIIFKKLNYLINNYVSSVVYFLVSCRFQLIFDFRLQLLTFDVLNND